jgi:hypothetical protein
MKRFLSKKKKVYYREAPHYLWAELLFRGLSRM